jgi:hypothetical protein
VLPFALLWIPQASCHSCPFGYPPFCHVHVHVVLLVISYLFSKYCNLQETGDEWVIANKNGGENNTSPTPLSASRFATILDHRSPVSSPLFAPPPRVGLAILMFKLYMQGAGVGGRVLTCRMQRGQPHLLTTCAACTILVVRSLKDLLVHVRFLSEYYRDTD